MYYGEFGSYVSMFLLVNRLPKRSRSPLKNAPVRTMITIRDLIKDYILVSLFAFVISVLLTPLIRRWCQQKHILDFPVSPRKIHTIPVPRLGGVAIYLAFFIPLALLFFDNGVVSQLFSQNLNVFLSLFLTSTLVFAIGVYDDIRGATVFQKFSVQIGAAALLYFLGFQIQLIAIPFFGPFDLGVFGFPVTILWLVGVSNALNFIDGIDGLACGVGFFAVSTMLILSLFLHHPLTAFFAAVLAGGLFGFALYNFNPASIFMGDSGSLFVGFVIAAISLEGSQKSSTAVVLLIPIVVLGVPIADTLLAIIRRIGKGRSPFTADKEHIHHRLLNMGFSSRRVTLVLYGVCSLLGVTALLMTAVNNKVLTLILIILSVMVIGSVKLLGYTVDFVEIHALTRRRIEQKRRSLHRQKIADEILTEMRTASDLTTLQKMIVRYFEIMDLDIGKVALSHMQITEQYPPGKEFEKTQTCLDFMEEDVSTWYSFRYEDRRIPIDHIWTMGVPLILRKKKCGELFIGKYLDSSFSLSFFEITIIVESLKNAIEQTLLSLITKQNQHTIV